MGLTNVATAGGDAPATLSAGIALDLFGARAVFAMMGIFFLARNDKLRAWASLGSDRGQSGRRGSVVRLRRAQALVD